MADEMTKKTRRRCKCFRNTLTQLPQLGRENNLFLFKDENWIENGWKRKAEIIS